MVTTLEPMRRNEPVSPSGAPAPGPAASIRRPAPELGEVPALLIDHVTKRFVVGRKKKPVMAVDDVSIRIERGETYGILGANGGGKSTLIRLVSTLLTLDTGRVEVFGHDIERDEMAVKRLINRVSVDAAFFKKLSPYENLIYAARLYGLDAGKAKRDAVRHPRPARHRRVAPGPAAGADEPGHAAEGRHRQGPPDEPDAAAPGRADDRPRPALQAGGPDLHRGDPGGPRRDHRAHHARPRGGRPAVRPDRRSSTDGRLVAEGTPEELVERVAREHGQPPTLESVFMTWTGRSLDDDTDEEDDDDD